MYPFDLQDGAGDRRVIKLEVLFDSFLRALPEIRDVGFAREAFQQRADPRHRLGIRRHIHAATLEAEIGHPVDGQSVGDVLAQGCGIVVLPVLPIEFPQLFQARGVFGGDSLPDTIAQRMIVGRREFGVVTGRVDGGHDGK